MMYENMRCSVPKYHIGRTLFHEQAMPSEGIYYSYQEQENVLMVILPEDDMWGPKRSSVLYKPTDFAITVQEDILFFLSKFHNRTWNVSPYHHFLFSKKSQNFEKTVSRQDKLHILLINHLLGSIQGVRIVNLSSDFVDALNQILRLQLLQTWMDETTYNNALTRVKEKYPSPEDLLSTTNLYLTDVPTPPTWQSRKDKIICSF